MSTCTNMQSKSEIMCYGDIFGQVIENIAWQVYSSLERLYIIRRDESINSDSGQVNIIINKTEPCV